MNERESPSAMAVRLWRRVPFAFGVAIAFGYLGVDALLTDLGVVVNSGPSWRYVGAASSGVVGYLMASDWRRDAREREHREIDRTEA